ncbi:hypothetical protein Catovirus_1_177 [Catovirus CTV1]|uniref:Uncharacterized protein n=1 Tax=Catovirus CTV1 TaxID=1977631 RepID=A0A1V0S8T9_9VIRU|nr:hypothetical protein Catovirus_1_177 [Catovirus CTV1]
MDILYKTFTETNEENVKNKLTALKLTLPNDKYEELLTEVFNKLTCFEDILVLKFVVQYYDKYIRPAIDLM